jgi:ribonuclease P protein component
MHAKACDIKALEMITARGDFLKIQSKGRKWVSHGLILQVLASEDADKKRIGYTVSKKVSKSAVKRNRIKRRLRAAAADVLPGFAAPGHDYVLVGRPEGAKRPYATLCEDLKWCLRKMRLEAPSDQIRE